MTLECGFAVVVVSIHWRHKIINYYTVVLTCCCVYYWKRIPPVKFSLEGVQCKSSRFDHFSLDGPAFGSGKQGGVRFTIPWKQLCPWMRQNYVICMTMLQLPVLSYIAEGKMVSLMCYYNLQYFCLANVFISCFYWCNWDKKG